MSRDTDRRRPYVMFPGHRPGMALPAVYTEPGSRPRNNDRPVRPYAYHGTGRDTLTGFLDATLSPECFDEKCGLCRDPDCACACEHEHRRTA